MSFENRREMLFIYTVKDANPNGDPLNANHPRYDAETGQILVSDVRIKRTIRDQWLREGENVFVDAEPKTLPTRIEELKDALSAESGKEALSQCLDTRLFGVTFAHKKESFSWTGPVQFKWGRSLHQAKPELVQGTGAFATADDSEQRTFRNEYLVPFVVLGVYGIANQNSALATGATEEDLEKLSQAIWDGTLNLITRSKIGHQPRLLLEIIYEDGFQGLVGALDDKIQLEENSHPLDIDAQLALRNLKSADLNLSEIVDHLAPVRDQIHLVRLRHEKGLSLIGLEALRDLLQDKLEVQIG